MAYLKLRRTPEDEPAEVLSEIMGQETSINKYEVYPADASKVLVGEDELMKSTSSDVLICKGELDRIIAIQEGVKMPVVTGGGLVQMFKKEWMESLKNVRNIYLCLGENAVSKRGATVLAERLAEHIPLASIYIISLPFEENACEDLFIFARYAKEDFDSDDWERKRVVIKRLGADLRLSNRTIQFTPVKYLVPVAEKYPELK